MDQRGKRLSLAQGVSLGVGVNNEVFACWTYYDVSGGYEAAIGFNKSTNGGQNWTISGFPKRITPTGFSGIRGNLQKGTVIRVRSFPSMDIDKTNRTGVHQAYAARFPIYT